VGPPSPTFCLKIRPYAHLHGKMAATALDKLIPGLNTIRTYKSEWFRSDLVAGLSVAAVALPIGIAYAQLAGFPPVVGIYSCIFPLVAYAFFGSSRQLIVNPDAAACAIVASTVAPLAVGSVDRYLDLAIALTLLTGLLCIVGGSIGFGAIANFLSKPILTGYLNGIALSIIVGQLGKLLGFQVASGGFFKTLYEVVLRIGETQWPTAVVGISLFLLLRALRRFFPKIPAPLIAAIVGIAAVYALDLGSRGVALVGFVPAGFPAPRIPSVGMDDVWPLVFGSIGIVLVSFCSMMTTARGFAAKNGYEINANQDMIALGLSDIASGVGQGFVVSGADSRTAVADSSGGKTQMTGIVAAAVMSAVLLFFTFPLAKLPTTALAAILISSAMGLFDFESVRRYFRLSKPEFRHSIIAMLGVMTIGVLPGVLIAVALALLNLLLNASHPRDSELGHVHDDVFDSKAHGGRPIPGLVIYRFHSGIVFFNADYFKERVRLAIKNAEIKPAWFIFNAESTPGLDVTGADALDSIRVELAEEGITLVVARASGFFRLMLQHSGLDEKIGKDRLFPNVHSAVQAFLSSQNASREQTESHSTAAASASGDGS